MLVSLGFTFLTAFINRQKYRFNARSGLGHQAGGAGGGNGKQGNIPAAVFHHIAVHLLIFCFQTQDKRIIFFEMGIINGERTAFLGYFNR